MAESLDPNKVFVGTRLFKDEDANGVILDDAGEWKSGRFIIELFDTKTGAVVDSKEIKVSRNKYNLLREDLNELTTEEVIADHFPKAKVAERSQTDLQVEAERSAKETKEREAAITEEDERVSLLRKNDAPEVDEVENADGEKVVPADAPSAFENVLPVGSPEEEPSNPEQKLSAEEVAAKGGTAVGSDVKNPEQSAPNVPEDKFDAKGGKTEKPSVTTDVSRDVTPVGDNAKTNKDVEKAK